MKYFSFLPEEKEEIGKKKKISKQSLVLNFEPFLFKSNNRDSPSFQELVCIYLIMTTLYKDSHREVVGHCLHLANYFIKLSNMTTFLS